MSRATGTGLAAVALALLAGGRAPAQLIPAGESAYAVSPQAGPWMICVATHYVGQQGLGMAQDLVTELRRDFKLNAYLFNFAAQERKKEEERVELLKKQQRDFMQQMGISGKARVRTVHYEDQFGVLVGGDGAGWPTMEAAKKMLDQFRARFEKAKPSERLLDKAFVVDGGSRELKQAALNPFTSAFVVHNPTVPMEKDPDADKPDPFLKELNSGESLSLLKCRKPFTLVVKQFQGPTVIQSGATNSTSFVGKLGIGKGSGELLDASAHTAHGVAELLRKLNFEAFVLHTRGCSYVCVGEYDRADEQRLLQNQRTLANLQLKGIPDPSAPVYRDLQLFAQPQPMAIPRP
jgi:hypothetical protein